MTQFLCWLHPVSKCYIVTDPTAPYVDQKCYKAVFDKNGKKKQQNNCENLLSCHFTFSMNTYKTLKSFSLTSTKMWVGGREGVTGGVSLRETMQWSVEPRLPCPPRVVFFFFFNFLFSFALKNKNPKNLYEQLRFPIIFLNHVVPSFWIVPIFQADELYVPTVRPVVAGEDRLRFAKSIFLDFNSLSRARPVKLQILHNYNIFYRDSINPVCSWITCKPIMHIALGDCWNYI